MRDSPPGVSRRGILAVHTKIQNEIQSRIQQTKQVLKASVSPKLIERADQVLLELSHTGQTIPNLLKQTFKKIEGNPHDVIGRLGRTVFERAESMRATLAVIGASAIGGSVPRAFASASSKSSRKSGKVKKAGAKAGGSRRKPDSTKSRSKK
jgi:hypothetical protein